MENRILVTENSEVRSAWTEETGQQILETEIYIQMLCIGLMLIVLTRINCLSCSNYRDYSGDMVRCASTCPAGSNLRNNRCLAANQYLIGEEVHLCERGSVNALNSVCCPETHYIASLANSNFCAKCNTRSYLNGRICCPGSHYADLTNSSSPKCTPLTTGPCRSLTIKSLFQVCCPAGLFYSIDEERCINPSSNNCDSVEKVCCPPGRKLDYVRNQFVCLANCQWTSISSFYCSKKHCNSFDQSVAAGPPLRKPQQNFKLFLPQKGCCYGNNPTGTCLDSPTFCFKRFANRGWAMCCQAGQFYSVKKRVCSEVCGGIILFEFFCLEVGGILNLQSESGEPSETSEANYVCNGRELLAEYPVCCPAGFFINSTQGCQYCHGRIFTSFSNQICCGYDQVYNLQTDLCEECNGILNKDGTLCCLPHQYFAYSIAGIPTCVDTCSDERMYKTNYCCDSLNNTQCQNRGYISNICSQTYLVEGACQACPSFCALEGRAAQSCAPAGSKATCQKSCPPGTVYFAELSTCLSCDPSCLECTQPFDSQYCSKCKDGYVYVQNKCSRCSAECLTCSISINSCQSCQPTSSRPLFSNGKCFPACSNAQYMQLSSATCLACDTTCSECSSSYSSQCTKCALSMYISAIGGGACSPCAYGCSLCYLGASRCYQCLPTLYLTDSQQCNSMCSRGQCNYYDASLGHNVCRKCHPSCSSCSNQPDNCISCTNTSFYISDESGLNLCYSCVAPCTTCTSASSCSGCDSGYFLDNSRCLRCNAKCLTCFGGTEQSCLSCFGESQLMQGKCVGCSSSCLQCDMNENCLVCKSSSYFYIGNCVQECPTHTFIADSKCLDCLANCSTCANSTVCISCATTHPILFQSLCLDKCPQNYEQQGLSCVQTKNDTNNNTNNNTNNDTNNNTNNNTKNNTDDNNTDNNNTNNSNVVVKSQIIQMPKQGKLMTVVTTLNVPNSGENNLEFYLYNRKSNTKVRLNAKKLLSTNSNPLSSTSSTDLTYSVELPAGYDLKDSMLLTSVSNNPNSSTYYNSKSMWNFILYDYVNDPLLGLQYVGLVFTILIIIYSLITKIKGHFIAEEANTIILHMLNFIQVVYLFKYTRLQEEGMYHFLNGFGFMHFLMFPNFFYSTIPSGFVEYPAEKCLIPDGNFVRNAGSSISLCLVAMAVTGIASVISYVVYRQRELEEMPQIRKITRIGILVGQVTFLNILFTSFNYLVQPSVSSNWRFSNSCRVGAVIALVLIIILCLVVVFHYYKTYNSDVLEHYYTLREGCHFLLIICQAFIFAFAVGKPLICLTLIVMQVVWLFFNYLLYRYGEGDQIQHHVKFIVSSSCIVVAYLFLSLSAQVNWIAITVIVSVVVLVLIIYSSYQIVGLYYGLLFRKKVKEEEKKQGNKYKSEVEKESASRL